VLGLRVFVYDCPDATDDHQVGCVVNPVLRIPGALAAHITESEGCLSVPGQHVGISRPALASVTGQDRHGREISVTGTGLLARCLQHEADHLDGIVYVDKLPTAQRDALVAAAALSTPHPGGPPG
jgi:peptide deformylase